MSAPGGYACPAKPADCSVLEIPKTLVATCPALFGAWESEICEIWIVAYKEDLTHNVPVSGTPDPAVDWLDPANYDWAIPGTFAPGDLVHLNVIGDKPLAEFNDVTVSKRWIIPTFTRHTLNVDVIDFGTAASDDVIVEDACRLINYEMIKFLQQRPKLALWARTIDGLMIGGPSGIVCDVTSAGTVLGRGEGTLLTGLLVFSWESDCDPPMQPESSICLPAGI